MEEGEPPAKRLKLLPSEASATVAPLPVLPGASVGTNVPKPTSPQDANTAVSDQGATSKATGEAQASLVGVGLPVLPTKNPTPAVTSGVPKASNAIGDTTNPLSSTSTAAVPQTLSNNGSAVPAAPSDTEDSSSSAMQGIPPLPTIGGATNATATTLGTTTAETVGSANPNIAPSIPRQLPVSATTTSTQSIPSSQGATSHATTSVTVSSTVPPPAAAPSSTAVAASAAPSTGLSLPGGNNGLPPLARVIPQAPTVSTAGDTTSGNTLQQSSIPPLATPSIVPTVSVCLAAGNALVNTTQANPAGSAAGGVPPLPAASASTSAAALPTTTSATMSTASTLATSSTLPTASAGAAAVSTPSGPMAAVVATSSSAATPSVSSTSSATAPLAALPGVTASNTSATALPVSALGEGLPPLPAGGLGLPPLPPTGAAGVGLGLPILGGNPLPTPPASTPAAPGLPNLAKGASTATTDMPVLTTPAGLPLTKPKPGTPLSTSFAAGLPVSSLLGSGANGLPSTTTSLANNLGIPPLPSVTPKGSSGLPMPKIDLPTSTTLLSSSGTAIPTLSSAAPTNASSAGSAKPGTATVTSLGLTMPSPLTSLASSLATSMPGLPPLSSNSLSLDLLPLSTPSSSSAGGTLSAAQISQLSRLQQQTSGPGVLNQQQQALLQNQKLLAMQTGGRAGHPLSLPVPARGSTISQAQIAAAQRQRMPQLANRPPPQSSQHPTQHPTQQHPGGPGAGAAGGESDNRRRAIQQQLLLLIHAHKCQESQRCSILHCGTMKSVLQHMSMCKEGRTCQYAHCGSSRQIIAHYSHCKNATCPICAPLRKSTQGRAGANGGVMPGMPSTTRLPYPAQGPEYGNGTTPMGNGSRSSGSATHAPLPNGHAVVAANGAGPAGASWHLRLNQMHRCKLRQKLVEALTACVSQKDQQQKLADIKGLAKRIEEQVYQQATKQEDYYHLLAEKIYKLKKARPPAADPRMPALGSTPGTMSNPADIGLRGGIGLDTLPPLGRASGSPMAQLPSMPSTMRPTAPSSFSRLPSLNLPVAPVVPPNPNTVALAPAEASARPRAPRPPRPSAKAKVWTPDELRHHFLPAIQKIRNHEDAEAFHEPVDPVALNITDYHKIITRPMDLSTITTRLEKGAYKNPRAILDDLNLMWDNAWRYNRKNSRIYKITTKLSVVMEETVDPIMKRLGFCCGKRLYFTPSTLYCLAKNICIIPRDAKYKKYTKDVSNPVTYCAKCWGEAQEEITLGPEENDKKILRLEFEDDINDKEEMEPLITCSECGRDHHEICQLWHKGLTKKFVCKTCRKDRKRKDVYPFPAKKLQKTKLGDHIERRLRKVMKEHNTSTEHHDLTVRVVSIRDKTVTVGEGMKSYYADADEPYPSEFKYRTKAMFVWQKQDDVDVCFFGMHVQEYGSDCPAPNTGRVYISYLDSVFYFRPKEMRTIIYKELLVGYLEHCRSIGYSYAHIWACPPSPGDDYIFHCHPPDQKVPKPKRLQDWYKDMLNLAKKHKVIHSWLDMQAYVRAEGIACAREIAFFEGDYWPGIIEEKVKAIKAEEKESSGATGGKGGKKGSKKGKKTKAKAQSKKGKSAAKKGKQNLVQGKEELGDRCLEVLEKHKDVFFVAYLNDPTKIDVTKPIQDPDPDILADLMDGRDGFLVMCRDEHREFSTIRSARHSSLVLLYALHNADSSEFAYSCNQCDQPIGAMDYRWHCKDKECVDFDMCEKCYKDVGHPHAMEQLGFGMKQTEGTSGKSEAELKRIAMQRCMDMLIHACRCTNNTCQETNCFKMKQMMLHSKQCPGPQHSCQVCKQLVSMCCYHAKNCRTPVCTIPFCAGIKIKLRNKQRAQANSSMHLHRRRMAAMNQHALGMQPAASSASGAVDGGASADAGSAHMGAALVPSVTMASSSAGSSATSGMAPSGVMPRAANATKEQLQMHQFKVKAGQLDGAIAKFRQFLQQLQAKERSGQPLTPEQQAQKATAAAKLSQCMTNRQKISEIAQSYLQRNGQMAPSAAPVVDPQKKMMVEQLNNELRKLTPQQREQMLRQAVAKLQQVQSSSGDVLKQLSPIERHILSLHRLQKQTALMRQQQQQLALQQQQQLQQGVGGSGASASNGAFQYQQHMQRQSQQPHSQQMQPDQQQAPQAGDLLGSMADRL